jgi:ATP:cob(I)alamin adenosyltransferase
LLTIGSTIAGSKLRFSSVQTKNLEKQIDELEGKLPILKNFVVPGGNASAGALQYARSLSRRAERRVVALSQIERVKPQILEYLNRLSDYLLCLLEIKTSR